MNRFNANWHKWSKGQGTERSTLGSEGQRSSSHDIVYALQRGILLRRENPMYMYWPLVAAARHGFKMVSFTASCGNTFVGGTCECPYSFKFYRSSIGGS